MIPKRKARHSMPGLVQESPIN